MSMGDHSIFSDWKFFPYISGTLLSKLGIFFRRHNAGFLETGKQTVGK